MSSAGFFSGFLGEIGDNITKQKEDAHKEEMNQHKMEMELYKSALENPNLNPAMIPYLTQKYEEMIPGAAGTKSTRPGGKGRGGKGKGGGMLTGLVSGLQQMMGKNDQQAPVSSAGPLPANTFLSPEQQDARKLSTFQKQSDIEQARQIAVEKAKPQTSFRPSGFATGVKADELPAGTVDLDGKPLTPEPGKTYRVRQAGIDEQGKPIYQAIEDKAEKETGALAERTKEILAKNPALNPADAKSIASAELEKERATKQAGQQGRVSSALQTMKDPQASPEDKKAAEIIVQQAQKRASSTGGGTGFSREDAKGIAEGIAAGTLSPLQSGFGAPKFLIESELQKLGYNLRVAENDQRAVNKFLSTMNGQQQINLRQAVEFVDEHIPLVENVYQEWQNTALPNGFRFYNRKAMEAAKQLPGKAGAVATTLDQQVGELISQLGQVYRGGYAPTDKAIELATQQLGGDWNQETFEKAVDTLRKTIQIRKNSISNTGPVGLSQGSEQALPERPAILGPAPSAAPQQAQHQVGDTVMYQGKAHKVTGINPQNGRLQLSP